MTTKTEEEYANEVRTKLLELCDILTEAAEKNLTVNFGINIDNGAKKATITSLTVTKSFL